MSLLTRTLRIETAPVFRQLLEPSRYKAAYGGRGSGKSHFFAEKLVEDHLLEVAVTADHDLRRRLYRVGRVLDNPGKGRLVDSEAQGIGDEEFCPWVPGPVL